MTKTNWEADRVRDGGLPCGWGWGSVAMVVGLPCNEPRMRLGKNKGQLCLFVRFVKPEAAAGGWRSGEYAGGDIGMVHDCAKAGVGCPRCIEMFNSC